MGFYIFILFITHTHKIPSNGFVYISMQYTKNIVVPQSGSENNKCTLP